MTAVNRPIAIEQGATWTLGFNWHQAGADANTPGDPYDLTGWVARMQIRRRQGTPILLDASTSNGKIVLGTTNGRVDIKFSDEDTDGLATASALYDLELENPAGDVFRLLEGAVTVSPNITQEGGGEPVVDG